MRLIKDEFVVCNSEDPPEPRYDMVRLSGTIELSTHWTAKQLIELAGITAEGWDIIENSWAALCESKGEKWLKYGRFSVYLLTLITLAQDMKASKLSKEKYLKGIKE